MPFVASLALQGSLVILLAIPWTVQTLKNSGALPTLTMLNFRPVKPVPPPQKEPIVRAPRHSDITLGISSPRKFVLSTQASPADLPGLPSAPDAGIDFGGSAGAALLGSVASMSSATGAATVIAPPKVSAPRQPIPVGGSVQAAKLIRKVQPVYPPLVRQIHLQGVVVLEAIIGTDGTIQQLKAISGHPLLIPSAMQAVEKWMYSPTILDGKPVEVRTTVEVRFFFS